MDASSLLRRDQPASPSQASSLGGGGWLPVASTSSAENSTNGLALHLDVHTTRSPGDETYVDPVTHTPHLKEYPRSVKERLQMEDEMHPEQPSAMEPDSYDDSRSASQLQQQMLTQQLASDHHSHGMGHASLEIDDEEEAVEHKFPVRSAIVAGFLLIVGITCLIIGLVHMVTGAGGSVFAFVLIGGILVIPGGYQSWIIWNAWRRKPGFSFSQLAAYEGR